MINKKLYDDVFAGFYIRRCAVRNKGAFSFILFQRLDGDNDSEPKKRIATFFTDGDGDVGGAQYTGFQFPNLAIAKIPKEQTIMVALNGNVAAMGSGYSDLEADISTDGADQPLYTSAHALATIDGYVYAVGAWRSVCRRITANHWESIGDRTTLPVPKRNNFGSNDEGFDAIDGFNANDIYCAGGHGDVWRYDGTRWYQCAFPTNMTIENVCCAADGYVYIGMQSGSVIRGREDRWEMIHTGSFSLPFKDMVWYQDKVWCTSDYGIWTIENGKLVEPDLPAEVRACSGSLSTGDGVMLLAGMYGAIVYDGNEWTPLVRSM